MVPLHMLIEKILKNEMVSITKSQVNSAIWSSAVKPSFNDHWPFYDLERHKRARLQETLQICLRAK